jgi:uncharacterized SAM-binding protein YcdF (DUF218 family)
MQQVKAGFFGTRPWWFWPLRLTGVALLAHALYLVLVYGMFHFGIVTITLVGAAFVALTFWIAKMGWSNCQAWLSVKPLRRWIWRIVWMVFFVWLGSLLVFFGFIAADHDVDVVKTLGPKVILILGSGTPHCKVSKVLAARLDAGLKWAQKLPLANVVVSGGQDFGLNCTEAQVMADYLRAGGLDGARIVPEERSTSTFENIKFSLPVMQAKGIQLADTVLIITSDFHGLRARHVAYKAGFTSVASVGATTPLYARYTAWLREYFTYVSGWLLHEF